MGADIRAELEDQSGVLAIEDDATTNVEPDFVFSTFREPDYFSKLLVIFIVRCDFREMGTPRPEI